MPFFCGSCRRAGVDLEAVALRRTRRRRAARSGSRAQARVMAHLGLSMITRAGHRAEPLEGAAVTAQPSGHRLIPDELDVLVAARSTASSRSTRCARGRAAAGSNSMGPAPKSTWAASPGAKSSRHRRLRRPAAIQRTEHPVHGGITAGVSVLAPEGGMDDDARDALRRPSARWPRGRAPGWKSWRRRGARRAQRRGNLGVLGQRGAGLEPAARRRQHAERCRLAPAHESGAGDVALRIALPQSNQHLSILKHLESPAAHGDLPGTKSLSVALWPHPVRDARAQPRPGSFMPKTGWLQYAENSLAPMCRKMTVAGSPADDGLFRSHG